MMELKTPARHDPTAAATALPVAIRRPVLADAGTLESLARESEILDVNSRYLYLLLCRDFSGTCRVAQCAGKVVGFVSAYFPPAQPHVLFVWQIAVAKEYRGKAVALRMLMDLLSGLPDNQSFTIEATITPSNGASQALFQRLAAELACPVRVDQGFSEALFAPAAHESERMFYIGPVVLGSHRGSMKEHTSS